MRIVSLLAVEQEHPFGVVESELVLVEPSDMQAHDGVVTREKEPECVTAKSVVHPECIGARTKWEK
jgi:hypothetical protein